MRWTARVPANCWIFIGCPPDSPNNSIKTTEFPGFSFFRGSSRHLDFGIAQKSSQFSQVSLDALDCQGSYQPILLTNSIKATEFPGFSTITCQTKIRRPSSKNAQHFPLFYGYKWNVLHSTWVRSLPHPPGARLLRPTAPGEPHDVTIMVAKPAV